MEHKESNNLIYQNSPYLLQHAYNPVKWHVWDLSILEKSKKLNKPILVSIGYAACHWCHVMEKESFEDEATAAFMNEHFINVKVDREERPDLDQIYMDAVQVLTGSGGWPLHVFLNSEGEPFFGGTYFPKHQIHNRPSWFDVLRSIEHIWRVNRSLIDKQANAVMQHLSGMNEKLVITSKLHNSKEKFSKELCQTAFDQIIKHADQKYGGFGQAPKFPQLSSIRYLLLYNHYTKNESAKEHALFSLKTIIKGGIFDQLGGGISRYSTDDIWLAPHFEKMLYDNALLIEVLSEAYQITHDNCFAEAIRKTIQFCVRELKSSTGCFYSSLDADSEGKEGKYYVWEKTEIDSVLGSTSAIFCDRYGITSKGNWEESNILHQKTSIEELCIKFELSIESIEEILQESEALLLIERNKRFKPAIDNKLLLSWNAQLITAFCRAYAALGDESYQSLAIELFSDIKRFFLKDKQVYYHSVTNGIPNHQAYLDDYAYWIRACIHLQEITSNQSYLLEAKETVEVVRINFEDPVSSYFYYTSKSQKDVLIRKIDLYDNPYPCGNSIMCENLHYLGLVFSNDQWVANSRRMALGISESLSAFPLSFSNWGIVYLFHVMGRLEIVITGSEIDPVVKEACSKFIPNKIMQSSTEDGRFPLLIGKNFQHSSLIYVCFDNTCFEPFQKLIDFEGIISKKINN